VNLLHLPLPEGVEFRMNRDGSACRAAAQEMGIAMEIHKDLARVGGINIAAGIGRDGDWLRAFLASDAPAETGIDWMELSVSPVSEESTDWLVSVVSAVVRPCPQTIRFTSPQW
jgi:hypothetical protein